jgi:hypothetical protein
MTAPVAMDRSKAGTLTGSSKSDPQAEHWAVQGHVPLERVTATAVLVVLVQRPISGYDVGVA